MRVFHEMFRCHSTVVYKELLLTFLSIRENLQTLNSHTNEISIPISLIRLNSKPRRTLPAKQEVKNIIFK